MALLDAYRALLDVIGKAEPRTCWAIRGELTDQRASLKLIASENYASPLVFATMGIWLSDKYVEGIIDHRFCAGCQNVDVVEPVAAEHAHELFGAEYVYAQPHSGIDVNLTAYRAILVYRTETPVLTESDSRNASELSETDWEMLRAQLGSQRSLDASLDAGGRLTHGFRPNVPGKMFCQRSYGTNPTTGLPDYDALAMQAAEFKPLAVVAGYSVYPRCIDLVRMREIADSVGAVLMVDTVHFAGLVAGKVFTGNENPVPLAQMVTTTTHKSLCGPRGGLVLATRDYTGDVDRGCPIVLGDPLSYITAAKAAAPAEARTETFRGYAYRVADNARVLAEGLLKCGGTLVTGGINNYIVLLDVSSPGLTRRQAESVLLDSGIVTNRNLVSNDPNGAWCTSGIGLGTPALTSWDFTTSDADGVAAMITDMLKKTTPTITKDDKPGKAKYELAQEIADGSKDRATKLLDLHPLYPGPTL